MSGTDQRRRGRRQLLLLAALFFAPIALAWALVASNWRPAATTNQGSLVQPPVEVEAADWRWRNGEALPPSWFGGYWTLLMPLSGDCESACEQRLDTVRRVRIALDKDADRVRVLVLQPRSAAPPETRFDGLHLATAPGPTLVDRGDEPPAAAGVPGLYIIDFQGFRIMRYALPLDGSGLLDDLETLLRAVEEDIERNRRADSGAH